jgi:hypothetical protein
MRVSVDESVVPGEQTILSDVGYQPLRGRTRFACMMLYMSMMCSLSTIVLSSRVLSLLAAARAGTFLQKQLDEADAAHSLLLLFSFAIAASTALAFCLWLFRVQRKIRDEIGVTARFDAWYSVASFFIPVVNLRVPPLAVAEAWRLSTPESTPGKRRLLAVWWGLWLGWMGIAPVAVWFKLHGDYERGLRLGIVSEVVLMGSAIAAIVIVRSVSELWNAPAHPQS